MYVIYGIINGVAVWISEHETESQVRSAKIDLIKYDPTVRYVIHKMEFEDSIWPPPASPDDTLPEAPDSE